MMANAVTVYWKHQSPLIESNGLFAAVSKVVRLPIRTTDDLRVASLAAPYLALALSKTPPLELSGSDVVMDDRRVVPGNYASIARYAAAVRLLDRVRMQALLLADEELCMQKDPWGDFQTGAEQSNIAKGMTAISTSGESEPVFTVPSGTPIVGGGVSRMTGAAAAVWILGIVGVGVLAFATFAHFDSVTKQDAAVAVFTAAQQAEARMVADHLAEEQRQGRPLPFSDAEKAIMGRADAAMKAVIGRLQAPGLADSFARFVEKITPNLDNVTDTAGAIVKPISFGLVAVGLLGVYLFFTGKKS